MNIACPCAICCTASQGRANGDVAVIERYFDQEYDWSGRGLAIFSNQQEKFWKVYPLAIPIVDSVFIGPKPYLTPLANLWDVYGRFVVGLIDKQGARFIFVQMGEVIDGEGILGEEVRRVKSGAGSTPTGRRRNPDEPSDRQVNEVIKRNVKDTTHALVEFCEKHTPRFLVLGGNMEVVKEVRAHLPQHWAERVVGTIAGDVDVSDLVLRDRALKIVEEVEAQREIELADAAITAAAKNSHGATHIDRVLMAAHAGKVQTLLIAEGYQVRSLSLPAMRRCDSGARHAVRVLRRRVRADSRRGGSGHQQSDRTGRARGHRARACGLE